MKKRTIFLLTTAVMAMIIGGIGAIFFHRQSQQSIESNKQTHNVKNTNSLKEMHIILSGNSSYSIVSTAEREISFHPSNELQIGQKATLKVEEEKDQIAVDVKSQLQTKKQPSLFFFFGIAPNSGTITIPSSVEKLVVSGDLDTHIDLENLKLTELTVNAKHADLHLSNISVDDLVAKTETSSITAAYEIQAKQASFVTESGSINLSDFIFDQLKTKSNDGDLVISQGRGTVNGTTNSGDISVDNLKGVGKFASKNGDFTLDTPSLPKDLEVKLEQGDIQVYANEAFHNIDLKAQSDLGTVSLLGKERTSYKVGEGTNHFHFTSKYGDITVE